VIRLLRRERFDVLWLNGYNFATHMMAAVFQKARRAPLLYWEEQTLLHPRAPLKAAAKQIGLNALFRGTKALYIGTRNRRWFERYGVPKERLFFTPYSVDNEAFGPCEAAATRRYELRRSFGIRPDAGPVILTVARLIPKKQPLVPLEAFRRVRQERRAPFSSWGSAKLEQELRRAAVRFPDVHLHGFVNQSCIAEAYAAADIFTLASKYHETWGVVVNEAMNFSLPTVVTDKVGSAIDLVRSGENGFIVSAEHTSELAHRLGTLADSAELRRRFGEASARIIEDWPASIGGRGHRPTRDEELAAPQPRRATRPTPSSARHRSHVLDCEPARGER
jgi:glycosyltransferase involved in cell wall biosynthesis